MKYFDISTIKVSIEHLQNYSANWLLPAFVFAANGVGSETFVDMSKGLGTDQFLDRYFNGNLLEIPPARKGNNLLRPRLKGIAWDRGDTAGDYIIRQDTKMWGNLFSSRGYREMRLEGLVEGEKAITKLTEKFQPRFEHEIPDSFNFESFLVWLFAFTGFPEEISSWTQLYEHLVTSQLNLDSFQPEYLGRFKVKVPSRPWPNTIDERVSNELLLSQLAPKFALSLQSLSENLPSEELDELKFESLLGIDDPVYSEIDTAIRSNESFAFLLAGPPGTGKTRYARLVAEKMSNGDPERTLFLQFHPAIGYDDFIEGFRPLPAMEGSGVKYELAPRLLLKFADKARADPEKRYFVIIDELNRGDVARIFGEVLTYLEIGYREVEFTLPYSGNRISLPKNLIFIATANPYDRSVTDLDDAFLRRFWVIEVDPDPAALEAYLKSNGVHAGVISRTVHAFNMVNSAFPNGFGHSNFMSVRTISDLARVWVGRIRLALRRTLMHDKAAFNALSLEIERLVETKEEDPPVEELGNILSE